MEGKVATVNNGRGFCFIRAENGDHFGHSREFIDGDFGTVDVGDTVSFEPAAGERGPRATRIRILETLAAGERSVGELQPLVGIESSHLSQQLGVLKRAGLVTSRKEGQSVFYSLRDPLIADLLAVAKQFLIRSLSETRDLLAGLGAERRR